MSTVKFKLTNPVHLLAVGFGSGLIKPAPGTWGTLAAIPPFVLIAQWVPTSSVGYFLILMTSFLIGIYLCGKTASDIGVHDHGSIVWDEFVGLWVALAWFPFDWQTVLLAFVLFRIFDIVKPWPIKLLDKHVHGGFGIMIDDIIAGVFAWIVLYSLFYFQLL